MTRYAFIDGSAFSEFLKTSIERLNLDPPAEFSLGKYCRMIGSFGFDRIFYYDAYPQKTDNEDDEQFRQRYDAKEAYFKQLNRLERVHVRTGTTRHRKKTRGGLQQKGVDIQLALDVYQHAIHDNMNTAVIFANDLDFYPLLEALTQTRVNSELRFVFDKTPSTLIEAADIASPLTLSDFMKGCVNYNSNFGIRTDLPSECHFKCARNYLDGKIFVHSDQHSHYIQYDKHGETIQCFQAIVGLDYIESLFEKRMSKEDIDDIMRSLATTTDHSMRSPDADH